jgi:signal peptidase I
MKKAFLILVILLLITISSFALADVWVCPICGKTNTTNFCTFCGTKHDSWRCPNCGENNSNAFCGTCGTAKPSDIHLFTLLMNGQAMNDTIADGEILLFKASEPLSIKRFCIVAVTYPGEESDKLIKRLIGLPGDQVRLENGQLYVNGTAYEEPYVNDEYRTGPLNTTEEYTVPKKGDAFIVHFEDNRHSFLLNGERWPLRNSVMKCRDETGKALTIRDGGRTFVYDRKTYNQEDQAHAEELTKLLISISDKKFTVDEDYYFVMGDHRNNSSDSRSQGALCSSLILGEMINKTAPERNP